MNRIWGRFSKLPNFAVLMQGTIEFLHDGNIKFSTIVSEDVLFVPSKRVVKVGFDMPSIVKIIPPLNIIIRNGLCYGFQNSQNSKEVVWFNTFRYGKFERNLQELGFSIEDSSFKLSMTEFNTQGAKLKMAYDAMNEGNALLNNN